MPGSDLEDAHQRALVALSGWSFKLENSDWLMQGGSRGLLPVWDGHSVGRSRSCVLHSSPSLLSPPSSKTVRSFMNAQAQAAVTSVLASVMPTRDGVQETVPLRRRRFCPGNAGIASSDASLTACPTSGSRMGWRMTRGSRQLAPCCQSLLRSGEDSNKRSKEVSNCSTPVLQGAGGCDVGSGIAVLSMVESLGSRIDAVLRTLRSMAATLELYPRHEAPNPDANREESPLPSLQGPVSCVTANRLDIRPACGIWYATPRFLATIAAGRRGAKKRATGHGHQLGMA